MFDHLVKENELEAVMLEHGLTLPDDLVFIKNLIKGAPEGPTTPSHGQAPVSYHGNPVRKRREENKGGRNSSEC